MKKFLIIIAVFALPACQPNAPTNRTAKPATTVSVNHVPNNSISANVLPVAASPTGSPEKAKIRTFEGKGVVTKINLELVSVELDHEEIKGLMPKMTMEFYVKEKSELERLKVGDRVDFVLENNQGEEKIISIKKAQ